MVNGLGGLGSGEWAAPAYPKVQLEAAGVSLFRKTGADGTRPPLVSAPVCTPSHAPPWFDSGYSKFQSNLNDFLDSSGYEPGVWYFWNDEDTLVMLGGAKDAKDIRDRLDQAIDMKLLNTGSSTMNPYVVELDNGSWAIKLNAQMTQDRT